MPDQTAAPVVSLPVGAPINTADQLGALPVGSVARGREGQVYAHTPAGWFGAGRTGALYDPSGFSWPLTLLHRPGAPVPAPTDEDRGALARLIWETSRRDESTISATGANIVADAVMAAGFRRSSVPVDTTTEWGAPAVAWQHGWQAGWDDHKRRLGDYEGYVEDGSTPNPYRGGVTR